VDERLLRRLDELCKVDYEPGDPDSVARFLDVNHDFHVAVAEASGNSRLAAVVESTLHGCERFFYLGLQMRNRSGEMSHEHQALVDALVAGDAELAHSSATEQIQASHRMVIDALLTSSSLMSATIGAVTG
jgi:DNA-binding GntR family transcriptional regulator